MEREYKRTDWDIISFKTKEGEIIDETHAEFEKLCKMHEDWEFSCDTVSDCRNQFYKEQVKSNGFPVIYSVRNNVFCPTGIGYQSEILTIGDEYGTTFRGSNPKERSWGKILAFYQINEQMCIEEKRGGQPVSNMIAKIDPNIPWKYKTIFEKSLTDDVLHEIAKLSGVFENDEYFFDTYDGGIRVIDSLSEVGYRLQMYPNGAVNCISKHDMCPDEYKAKELYKFILKIFDEKN